MPAKHENKPFTGDVSLHGNVLDDSLGTLCSDSFLQCWRHKSFVGG